MAVLNPLVALFIVAVVVAVFWFSSDDGDRAAPQSQRPAPEQPDVYASNVSFQQLTPTGKLHYRLDADSIRQFASQDLTRMTEPDLHLPGTQGAPWDIKSRTGFVRKEENPEGVLQEVVHLNEDVHMVQSHPQNGLVIMRTESIAIYPDRQYAESDQNVMIDTDVGRTEAAGMSADLETGVVSLTSDSQQRVHTIVLPEQFKRS